MFDVIVIGGGPAGLIGATYLARFRRSVLLLDAGSSRAAKIPRSHNYPGFAKGVAGPEILTGLREQAEQYCIEFMSCHVDELVRSTDGYFEARWSGGRQKARKVLLATGATDIAPRMLHTAQALQEGALRYCPVCDGFEVIDQRVGVIAEGPCGVREALYLRDFTSRITLFLSSADSQLDEANLSRLDLAGIVLADQPVRSIRLWNGQITVAHVDSETTCDSVYAALGMQVQSALGVKLGATVDEDGYLETDRHRQTTVTGLYAAGDVGSGLNQIAVAAGDSAVAAAAIHQSLKDN